MGAGILRIELDRPLKALLCAVEVALRVERALKKTVGAAILRIELVRPPVYLLRAVEVARAFEDASETPEDLPKHSPEVDVIRVDLECMMKTVLCALNVVLSKENEPEV